MKVTRRKAIGILASTAATVAVEQEAAAQAAASGTALVGWLGGAAPALETGVGCQRRDGHLGTSVAEDAFRKAILISTNCSLRAWGRNRVLRGCCLVQCSTGVL